MARNIGGQYTTHRVLGRGGAGTVWLGEGPEGPVAIKVLREDLAADPDLAERFAHERHALLGLEHPHIVGVHDLLVSEGPEGRDIALVMDLVRGPDLRAHLDRERRLAPHDAVALTAEVASALAVAHAAGIVHRDVKPENILLDPVEGGRGEGAGRGFTALLTDFGVAKLIDEPRHGGKGGVVGTPDYMAPEIVEGLPPRAAVDIYALVTVLYELLAGFTPFGGGHPGAVLRRQVTETAAPLPGVPAELWELIQQCLAKAPASRLRAAELASRLRELLPAVAGLPPLDIGDPLAEPTPEAEPAPAAAHAAGAADEDQGPERVAVPLVRGAAPDSERATHTRMRVPDADELAGGAHGTARVIRPAGAPRAGSARHGAAARRRRRLAVTAAALLAAGAVGGWLLFSGGDGDSGDNGAPPGVVERLDEPGEP
ncbi:serine/threonine-protein kinase [Streptomyces radicis]|uniref:non-specific serine/threonine protein kinase n=1 Tax=Streptomyces radicis TaxID=1750517 RepID=A0A3A9W3P3_9ACTN|nr:serine/threonine-protein kinase [Streptomyces radicis]RKN07798.1 serine/threonine protein kinase [Streptomyces radicis]RKN20746.1 serine/threonine protein kinase [Streptomyces radicis]